MLKDLIVDGLTRHHGRVLLDTGAQRWTFGRLLADAHRRARAEEAPGRDALAMRNGWPLLVEFVARLLAGAPPLFLNPAQPQTARAELAKRLGFPRMLEAAGAVAPQSPFPKAAGETPREDEAAFFLLTSGTTGAPRMAARSHRSVAYQTPHIAAAFGLFEGARVLAVAPFFHSYGLEAAAVCCIFTGATLLLPEGAPFGLALAEEASRMGATHVFANPPLVKLLADARAGRKDLLPDLRVAVTAGARLADPLAVRFADLFGHFPRPVYGLTETGCVSVSDGSRPPLEGDAGDLLPEFAARVTDLNGNVLPEGSVGGVEIKKPFADLGYPNDAAETSARFVDGWFRTGDLGRISGRAVHLLGSRSGRLNVGGEKVDPGLVEAELLKIPGVAECVVYGAPHAALGVSVRAAVHATDPSLTSDALRGYLREVLEPVAVPSRIDLFPDPLPRTPAGKLSRALFERSGHAGR